MFVVPDAHPRVQLIVDDTCAASHISTNTGVAPRGTFRAGDAIGVEIAGNRARALTRCELAEDALDDERFRWIDLALPAHKFAFAVQPPDDAIAEGIRSGGEALLDPPRSEEHTSELQSLMRISYAVFCLKKKN